MLKRVIGAVAGIATGTAASATLAAENVILGPDQYELLATTLDGRLTLAIVNEMGVAVAVEFDSQDFEQAERADIVRGVAAGAILSDLREREAATSREVHIISSGVPHSVVRLNGRTIIGLATADEAAAIVADLPVLTGAQRAELRSLLSLTP